jgi:hypothetical protein
MDSFKLAKSLGVYILIGLLAINIFLLFQNKNEAEEMKMVQDENLELKKENNNLQLKVEMFSPTGREEHYNTMVKDAKTFVTSAYVQQKEGYEERKEQAKSIMSRELLERYFPADTTYQEQVITRISNDQYFIQELEPDQKTIDVIVKFEHELEYILTGNVDKSEIFALIKFKKEGDNWVATEVQDVDADSHTLVNKESN